MHLLKTNSHQQASNTHCKWQWHVSQAWREKPMKWKREKPGNQKEKKSVNNSSNSTASTLLFPASSPIQFNF